MTLHASIIVLKSLPATGMGVLGGPVSGSSFERRGGLDPTRLGDGAVTRRLITDVAQHHGQVVFVTDSSSARAVALQTLAGSKGFCNSRGLLRA